MDFVVNRQQSFLGDFQLVLGFGLGRVVLFPPERKLFIHGFDVVVDKLNAFSQGSSILADTLDHILNKLKLFVSQFSARTNQLL